MEQYFNYIISNFDEILFIWFFGLPVFIFFTIIRTIIYVIFNEEPFGFFSDLKSELKNIKIRHILVFLTFYSIFIFGLYIPQKINNHFITSLLIFIFMIWAYCLEHKRLINNKLKRNLNFDDKIQYAIILLVFLISLFFLIAVLFKLNF